MTSGEMPPGLDRLSPQAQRLFKDVADGSFSTLADSAFNSDGSTLRIGKIEAAVDSSGKLILDFILTIADVTMQEQEEPFDEAKRILEPIVNEYGIERANWFDYDYQEDMYGIELEEYLVECVVV